MGGKASHVGVADALAWVENNVERVRLLGERREARAPAVEANRRHREALAVIAWKNEHAEMWSFVEDMLPCDFKYSVLRAIEERRLTPKQEEALQKMVEAKRKCDAPAAGTRVDVLATITAAWSWVNLRRERVFRIDFRVAKGWSGRIEVTDEATVMIVQGRRTNEVRLQGQVLWSKDSYAILSSAVAIEFQNG